VFIGVAERFENFLMIDKFVRFQGFHVVLSHSNFLL
jgi:hypothetical protein